MFGKTIIKEVKVIENLCDEGRYGMCNYFDFMSVDDGDFCDMEVIGNIYENKDLLS